MAKTTKKTIKVKSMFGPEYKAPKTPNKKNNQSAMDKFWEAFKKEMTRPTQRVRSTDGDPKPKKKGK